VVKIEPVRQIVSHLLVVLAVGLGGSPQLTEEAFDVASIRPVSAEPDGTMGIVVLPGGRFRAPFVTARELIEVAYSRLPTHVVGGPSWLDEAHFSIEARSSPGATRSQVRQMIRSLLGERFSLAVHEETRVLSGFTLSLARGDRLGPRLRRTPAVCTPFSYRGDVPAAPAPPAPPGFDELIDFDLERPRCPTLLLAGHWSVRGATLQFLAATLAAFLGQPVANHTELAGEFDADLTFASSVVNSDFDAPLTGGDGAPIRTAVTEQLGLRLNPSQVPVAVVVVDHVNRPTEN